MKESDLYLPLKQFLESQQYEVKGEVLDCDVMAVRGEEEPVVVELKQMLNLEVVLQAVDRLNLTTTVYIGIPAKSNYLKRNRKRVIKLLKMLGLGLIEINPGKLKSSVTILIDPGAYRPRISKFRQERLLGEFVNRSGDPNLGGKEKKDGIMTAYRQNAIAIARLLRELGPIKASIVAEMVKNPKAREIMYRDVYGWFDKTGRGVYALSEKGKNELSKWKVETPVK